MKTVTWIYSLRDYYYPGLGTLEKKKRIPIAFLVLKQYHHHIL